VRSGVVVSLNADPIRREAEAEFDGAVRVPERLETLSL